MRHFALVFAMAAAAGFAQEAGTVPSERERQLLERVQQLEQRLAALERRLDVTTDAPHVPAISSQPAPPDATLNVLLDGYYEYDFNHPASRVALLRPFDPVQNSFTLSQGVVVLERAADPAQGRRWGARLDLMFGSATESLSGNPANEPRTEPYRNIYQAYGTYVVPLGTGLNVDFGRFSSPLGMEGAFAKDQINYTRSLLYTALPFYHMGFRTSYKVNGSTTATWLLVNGVNQTEDFNGFKSNAVLVTSALSKKVTWAGGYYVGRETGDGRTHIADTYLTWAVTPKVTLAGEGDYVVSRAYANSAPSHLGGGAGYAKYQLAPAFSLAGRFEYVSDRGVLTGATQSLLEGTVTASYQPADGFQIRWEYRHDHANRAFFPTEHPAQLRKDQNTALLGLLFWFGGKQGAW